MTRFLLVVLLTLTGFSQSAFGLGTGTYTVTLEGTAESVDIGRLEILDNTASPDFKMIMDETKFSDQFLSMRPFKCIDGDIMICHLAYPYEKHSVLHDSDLADLEYEFLFIVRSPSEYGIDPYNGRYFILQAQNDEIVGTAYAVDLNLLASPPEDGNLRPLTHDLLDEIESERERFGRIRIHQSAQ